MWSEYDPRKMGSWTCSLCRTDNRWPSKQQALDHIEQNHLDSLLRASLERVENDPNVELDV